MSQQQTVLRVQTNIPGQISGSTTYEFLDLYSSIPISINKSFAELGDIGKRNSDFSVGVLLPGSKKNNRFFENFFNVDATSLYFNPLLKVPCNVLINDEAYFTGYMRLNKISVKDSKVEYDVTLYSTPAELYGNMGNNLLRDLNFSDDDYRFNHTFNLENVTEGFTYQNFQINGEKPKPYFYPVVHNGYLYTGSTVNFTGGTILSRTRLYTSTANSAGQLTSYASQAAAFADGVQQFRINSPGQGLYDNQLKPALNLWSLIQLMFKTYGYQIESDFFNTPWMKSLYMYGYFSSDATKFSFQVYDIQSLPLEGVEVFFVQISGDVICVISKLGTGIPCLCDEDINIRLNYTSTSFDLTIPYGTSGLTVNNIGQTLVSGSSPQVPNGVTLKYLPVAVGTSVNFVDGDFVDFNLVIDQNIKQIDILSSIAKKFNLVLIPDPNNGSVIRIEPYDFFIGTGGVHNWSDKISYDKGFTVEPALNFIESELQITDQEDSDEGNKLFKESNNRIYGQNFVYNPTDFKSQTKKIDTIFSPELIRKWDADGVSNIGLPLGINYVGSNNQVGSGSTVNVNWTYKGVKTKPKLMFWLGNFNPFIDLVGETFNAANFFKTYTAYISNTSGSTYNQFDRLPVISHTMPMGNPDSNKINNDSQCILFNSEFPSDETGLQTFNTYTNNDAYATFYQGRVDNLYNPNTRVLTGYFNLSYSDLKNLNPQDLIKIQEQYFVVSKIDEFNLTNRELTKVELVQYNGQPKVYPERYFKYFYCDNPSTTFKFKTDFTNPNLLNTNYGWSVYYDHQIGSFSGDTSNVPSGFTSTFLDDGNVYVPYYIFEVSEDSYNSSGLSWVNDTLHNYIYSFVYGPFQQNMPTFWLNSGSTVTGINLFADCAAFNTARTTYGIVTGSSTNHGAVITPTATPTPTPTPTPGTSERMRGSLLMTFNEYQTPDYVNVYVNSELRDLHNNDVENLYSTYLYLNDIVTIEVIGTIYDKTIDITRTNYTTNDQNADNGITQTYITGTTGTSISAITITFTATTIADTYDFEYLVDARTLVIPTPTPTPTDVPDILGGNLQYGFSRAGYFPQTNPWRSLDSGNSWSPGPLNTVLYGGVSSGDGTHVYCYETSQLFKSSTYGGFFTESQPAGSGSFITSISTNSNGQYVLFGTLTSGAFVSNNYGSTYVNKGFDIYPFQVAMSQDGTRMIAMGRGFDLYSLHRVYMSTDYGVNWNLQLTTPTGLTMGSIAISDDNKYVSIVGSSFYYSSDSGNTYTLNTSVTGQTVSSGDALLVNMSSDGRYQLSSFNRNQIFRSTNYGVTWTKVTTPASTGDGVRGLFVSKSGKQQTISLDNSIYTSNNYGGSWTFTGKNDFFIQIGGSRDYVTVIPTPTPTPTPSSTATPTPTPTTSPTPTPSSTATPTPTSSSTPTPTPTASSTPTATPTPTPTPVPATLSYRIVCNKGNPTGTFTYSNLNINLNGVLYTFTNQTFSSTGTRVIGPQYLTDPYIFSNPNNVAIYRDICKSTGTHTRNNSFGRVYVNGVAVGGLCSITTNTTIPTCSTQLSNILGSTCFGSITINPGDDVIVEWTDDTI